MGQDRLSSIAVINIERKMQTRQCRMTCKGLLTYLGVEVIVLHTSFKAQMGTFFSHFMVLYFRNVHLDLPKIFALFWTPVLSRHGEENLTSRKNHLVHLWPTSFIRANYVQPPQQNFPVRRWQLLLKNRSMINTPEYKRKNTKKRTCFLYSYVKKTPSYSRILLNRFRIRLDP